MAFRRCPNHGWIETHHYTPREGDGELVCKECGEPVTGYRENLNGDPLSR